jgi:hypothetical protein
MYLPAAPQISTSAATITKSAIVEDSFRPLS